MAYHWMKPLPYNIKCLLISDSRFRDYENTPAPNPEIYDTVNIIKRGARIKHLEQPVFDVLQHTSPNDIVIAYICAGINNLTYKEHTSGGIEIVPHMHLRIC